MQTFLMAALIVVLLTPLLLFYGLPLIAVGVLFYRHTARWLRSGARFVIACGIASLGIAPLFDQYWAPKSVYLLLWSGTPVDPWAAMLSFAITWLIVTLQARTLFHKRPTRA